MGTVTPMVQVIPGEAPPPPPKKYVLTLDEENAAYVMAILGMAGQDYATRKVNEIRGDITFVPHSASVWCQLYNLVKHDDRFMRLVREFGNAERERLKGSNV